MQNTKHNYEVSIIIGSCMCTKLSYGNFLPNGIRHAIVNEVCDPTAPTCSIQTSRTTGHKWTWRVYLAYCSKLTTMHGNINTVDWRNKAGTCILEKESTRGYWDPETCWIGHGKLFRNNLRIIGPVRYQKSLDTELFVNYSVYLSAY